VTSVPSIRSSQGHPRRVIDIVIERAIDGFDSDQVTTRLLDE
jgi:hypothetical protein